MGLFRRDKDEDRAAVMEPEPECMHVALSARWDDLDDMGREDKVSAWVCQSCSSVFTPAEAEELRRSESERIGATD